MDNLIESIPFSFVRKIATGTGKRKQSFYRRRKKPRSQPWEEETENHNAQKMVKNGHVDTWC